MLQKKNILITGVGKGIGYELLKQCLDNGSYVYGLTRSKSDLKKFRKLKNCKIVSLNQMHPDLFLQMEMKIAK